MEYHNPVLASEAIEALNIQAGGTYVDATFGGGGHARLILQALDENARLIGFDQDEDAQRNALDDPRFTFVPHNFRFLRRFLRLHDAVEVDGILADLGVSSHQLNEAERGFSFRFDTQLDMRMNQQGERSAADVLATYTEAELQNMFGTLGEVRNSRTLAQAIVRERQVRPMRSISDLLAVLDPLVRGQRNRYLAQVFQALRMEVNDEVGALQDFLEQSLQVLKPGGRLVVIAYHSIEDRMVKNFIKTGKVDGEMEQDFYGNITRPFEVITKKAMLPSEIEIKANPRSRSAKMRVAAKL
ncbi:MAG TPA: 16S rRNA (cytosine(1402)-N(4))-methyltransferase RsmH [Haliscomenobacter sp.]|uniref:16S rRNA (cytosine(1402)-N(4))-methyltransferase RsmH n=1 Tax=Haliscomenobacter sp. TaxID=2717303 RepID=UPI001D84036C|nr:16S rRNA (cytosine(1402)-N(4))-methyltransferase RsmH [Haliscomenobacter sp.]MBK9490380.1 16S rRNA (cytosine(1402)-N(4))-methyltransferase RsmH [Haliscomenobacter sp.]HOY16894.1 16S rRNA (cytosine(1402)-N(4))-methyltransferase RsmH [Haliscomenobacter sp.]